MLTFREGWRSFTEGLDRYFIWEYVHAVWNRAWEILWGAGVIGVAFTIYTLYYSPPWALLGWVVAWVFLVAGYFAWRADHIRLIPKFSVTTLCPPNEIATENPEVTALFIQIIPECLTDAPVHGCRARLLRVSKRSEDDGNWELTTMDAPLFLDWDYYGSGELPLEPGVRQKLNICSWSSASQLIVPSVHPLPLQFKTIFNERDTFKFDVRFTATDCEPVDVSVLVSLRNREWNNPQISLIQGNGNANR